MQNGLRCNIVAVAALPCLLLRDRWWLRWSPSSHHCRPRRHSLPPPSDPAGRYRGSVGRVDEHLTVNGLLLLLEKLQAADGLFFLPFVMTGLEFMFFLARITFPPKTSLASVFFKFLSNYSVPKEDFHGNFHVLR